MSSRQSPALRSKSVATERTRRQSATEIERVLKIRGVAPLAEKDLKITKEIGKGTFKKVYKGLLKQHCGAASRDVVVLQYKKQSSEVSELSMLALLAGNARAKDFVPQVFGVIDQITMVTVVQERAVHGTVKAALGSPELASQFTPQHKLNAAIKFAVALDYLQSLSIVHGDLACRNLLLFHLDQDPSTVSVKVTDFGLALVVDENCTSQVKKQPQATRWCSPETVASHKYSFHSDMWSFGICLWELFADGAIPWMRFKKRGEVTAMLKKLAQHFETMTFSTMSVDFPLPDTCPWDAFELIMSCLSLYDEARPTPAHASKTLHELAHVPSALEASIAVPDDAYSTPAQASKTLHELVNVPSALEASIAVPDDAYSTPAQETSKTLHELVNVPSSLEASIAVPDDADSTMSTEASEEPHLGELPVTAKLVRDLSESPLETRKTKSICTSEQDRPHTSKLKVLSDFLWSPYARSVLGDSSVQMMQQEVLQAEESLRTQPGSALLRDILLPPVQQGPVKCWASAPPLSIWTLWSLAENNTLRRQDFASEAAARAALEKGGAQTRVLRGPNNEEVYRMPLHLQRP